MHLCILAAASASTRHLFVFFKTMGGLSLHKPVIDDSMGAFLTILTTVIGFFATAGAAGVDFGMNSRDERDVRMGGLTGIALAIVIAGGLPLLSVVRGRWIHRLRTTRTRP